MLDILILVVLGLLLGAALTYRKINALYIVVIVVIVGAIAGFQLFYLLPFDLQSFSTLLTLQGDQTLSIVWNQTHDMRTVAMLAKDGVYYALGTGLSSTLLGYGIAALLFKLKKKKPKR